MRKYVVSFVAVVLIILTWTVAGADDVPMMTAEQLFPLLGKPKVVIIDVSSKYEWDSSKVKIKGAVREEGMKFGSWAKKYPKDSTIILYCG